MKRFVWIDKEIYDKLGKLGYVHFVTKKHIPSYIYKTGRSFYFDTNKKEYGLVDVIPNDEIKECEKNRNFILKSL